MAAQVEMLSGRRKKDYAAETGADTLIAQAASLETEPVAQTAIA